MVQSPEQGLLPPSLENEQLSNKFTLLNVGVSFSPGGPIGPVVPLKPDNPVGPMSPSRPWDPILPGIPGTPGGPGRPVAFCYEDNTFV